MKVPVSQCILINQSSLKKALPKSSNRFNQTYYEIRGFLASKSKIIVFIKLHATRTVSLHGEDICTRASALALKMISLRIRFHVVDMENISKVDESSFLFKFLPKRTNACKKEMVKSAKKATAMKSEDYITRCVWTDALGDEVPVVVVGKVKNHLFSYSKASGLGILAKRRMLLVG